MLVLSRRVGERIVIDDNITVTVVEIQAGKIRLGIEAPEGSSGLARGARRLRPPRRNWRQSENAADAVFILPLFTPAVR